MGSKTNNNTQLKPGLKEVLHLQQTGTAPRCSRSVGDTRAVSRLQEMCIEGK